MSTNITISKLKLKCNSNHNIFNKNDSRSKKSTIMFKNKFFLVFFIFVFYSIADVECLTAARMLGLNSKATI